MEYNSWPGKNPPEHEANIVFTRMLEGPMDFTPGVLSLKGSEDSDILSTIAKQLALYVAIYSPVQMAADTPENYAKAYAQEAGPRAVDTLAHDEPAAHSRSQQLAWAALLERMARNLERGGRQWTAARRKDSLKRVFDGSRSDPQRLQQRLLSLMKAWEDDLPADGVELGEGFESIVAPSAPSGGAEAAGFLQ